MRLLPTNPLIPALLAAFVCLSSSSKADEKNADGKLISSYSCVSSGTMLIGSDIMHDREYSLIQSISIFHKLRHRLPKGEKELAAFCLKKGIKLHGLKRLYDIKLTNDIFSYSAQYYEGTLHIRHIAGYYLVMPKENIWKDMKEVGK